MKYIFFVHGYPNGSSFFKKYIEKFDKLGYACVAINFRSGISVNDNAYKLKETILSYPKDSYKILIAHDFGAAASWTLLNEMPNIIDKYIALSVGFQFEYKTIYEDPLHALKYFYQLYILIIHSIPFINKTLIKQTIFNDDYINGTESYYYNFLAFRIILLIMTPRFIVNMFNIKDYIPICDIQKVNIPILQIKGITNKQVINDLLFSSKMTDQLLINQNKHNRVILYKDYGHAFPIDNFNQTFKDILYFIESKN